jgi:hypothetical protein
MGKKAGEQQTSWLILTSKGSRAPGGLEEIETHRKLLTTDSRPK